MAFAVVVLDLAVVPESVRMGTLVTDAELSGRRGRRDRYGSYYISLHASSGMGDTTYVPCYTVTHKGLDLLAYSCCVTSQRYSSIPFYIGIVFLQ